MPSVFYNLITLIGGGLAILALLMIILLMLVESISEETSPYVGIITFVILPVFMLIGTAVAAFGVLRQHHRRRLGLAATEQLPRIDLNNPTHLHATLFIIAGGVLVLGLSGIGSFKAYEYTDSDEFCGTMCHEVMQPEYTAFSVSPHARVGCVKCHIGPGAKWFAKSKLSGAYQVYAVLADKVPRPIETPIKNLRPSRDTCEQCHWPAHFHDDKLVVHDYFGYEDDNTHWRLHLLMKIGGGGEGAGPTKGIHWHMNIDNTVEYVATDRKRLEIPWVSSTRADGSKVIYRSTEVDISDEEIAAAEKREMDCIDCHNRPTHHYNPPARMINRAMAEGKIDPTLPGIKSVLVELLSDEYETTEQALTGIADGVRSHYSEDYPDVTQTQNEAIESAISKAQMLFKTNIFPEMKVSWREFPDHIGHLNTPGCFRCHDGLHETEDGVVLTRDCNICHTIIAQELKTQEKFISLESLDYKHPEDIDEEWKETNCSDCHGE